MRAVWPDSFVEENNLSQSISAIRKALNGDYIETVPKRGYRFTAPVALLGARLPAADFAVPETRYARSGDVNIAYQVVGDGPVDLVFVMGWVSHLEYFWREPSFARFLRRLASFSRLILFDKRGTGLSDRVPLHALPTLEQRMDDVRAVLDAVGSPRAAILSVSEGGPMSALFAATYPDKTLALAMIGTYARRLRDADYPWGPTPAERDEYLNEIESHWGGPVGLEERAPSVAHDPEFREWWATYLRMGASPGAAFSLTKMNAAIDVRNVLPSVRVPSLVIHRSGDRCLKVEEGRYVASLIPGARYVELPGDDHLPFVGDQDAILDEIESFLSGVARNDRELDRVLSTVLYLREVEPPPAGVLPGFREQVRRDIEWHGGRSLEIGASGPIAAFDGPARAIRCACAVVGNGQRLGLQLAAGLHTGECDRIGDQRIGGIAVDIASRVAHHGTAGEVLVSRTVHDLVAGSGIRFDDRDLLSLRPELGEWRIFRAELAR